MILRDLDQANNNSNRMDEYYPFDKAGELCFFIEYYLPAVVMTCVTCSKLGGEGQYLANTSPSSLQLFVN